MSVFSKSKVVKISRRTASILCMGAAVCMAPANVFSAPDESASAQNPPDESAGKLEALISTVFGQKSLRTEEELPEEVLQPLSEFWQVTLSLSCADKGCKQLKYTPESIDRFCELSTTTKDKTFCELIAAYDKGKLIAQENFLDDEIDVLFDREDLSQREKLSLYAGVIPLMRLQSQGSGDTVHFKKLQSVGETLSVHGYRDEQTVICSYAEDEDMTFEVEFELSTWIMDRPINMRHRILNTANADEAAVKCRIYDPAEEPGRPRDALKAVNTASRALLNGLIARDQDTIDASGNALLLEINHTRDDLGWASAFNTTWKDEDASTLTCKFLTLELQLLSQNRLVMASRLDEAMKTLFPGSDFYKQLLKTDTCMKQLKGTFRDSLRIAYEEHAEEYAWIVRNFAPDMRKKIDKAFSAWTKKLKPAQAKFRREIASFTALSLGDTARAGLFATNITQKLNRSNNPQTYGYDLAMKYVRGEAIDATELSQRLYEMDLKSSTHMFDTMIFAHRFMTTAQAKEAVDQIRNYSPALSPVSSAMLIAEYGDILTGKLSEENSVRVRLWALDSVWNAWRTSAREVFAKKLLSDCQRMNDERCIKHLSERFAQSPSETPHNRAFWEKSVF